MWLLNAARLYVASVEGRDSVYDEYRLVKNFVSEWGLALIWRKAFHLIPKRL